MEKVIWLLLYSVCLARVVFTIHGKNDDEGYQMLNKPTSHLLGELSMNKGQIGESLIAQQCWERDQLEPRAVLCNCPNWNLHSLNTQSKRSFEEFPGALWQKTGKQRWNQGMGGWGELWELLLKGKYSLWKMQGGWAQKPESLLMVLLRITAM